MGTALFFIIMSVFFPFLSRTSPVDKWFHVAAVWDSNANEAQLFLDGELFGFQALTSGSYPKPNSHSIYDIGLKRDTGETLKGYLRDLMIVGRAFTEGEVTNITGKLKRFV